jgi:serine protease Do
MKKINLKVLAVSLLLALAMGLAGCITITTPTATTTPTAPASTATTTATPLNPTWTAPSADQGTTLPSIADVVALVKPSVVAINTQATIDSLFGPTTQQGAGSGWILDGEKGYIVTNNHVVEGADSISVTLNDGRTFTAEPKSVFTDSLNDLAVIKIDATGLPALKVGDSSALRVGDWVVAIGNALGQGIRATEGIVSRTGVSLSMGQGETLYDLLETSAAINPGNSGGPLVNMSGEVIGITSAKVAQVGVEGMGYAISIDTASPIIQELINKGYISRPYIGVSLYTVDQIAIRQYRLQVNAGVLIVQVGSGSPADEAGLKPGDVIVSIGGTSVTAVEDFSQILYASRIGTPLTLGIWRGASQLSVSVTPIASPPPSG